MDGPQECFERPRDSGRRNQTPVTGAIPSSKADGGADDAPGDIRPLHSGALHDILLPSGRSLNI
ncbi:hypothetical protein T03_3755 [Trichinella britovi]|uniref:Uncharacterized protein n=1 Tax=Trichinella britovi TaxID=45882 RepID=A0A0V1CBU4_TRIBR|nr:hypothetical protein T03_3755 [Trichinella britovi]